MRRASSVKRQASDVLLLDNLEILFDVRLKQDPLRLLQQLSRNKTIVVAWPGGVVDPHEAYDASARKEERRATHDAGRYLTYAVPDHPEYRRYPIRNLIIVSASSVQRHASGGQV